MTELLRSETVQTEEPAVDAAKGLTCVNQRTFDFLFGAQRLMLEEMVFVGDEILDRARTETHLLSELVSKMAGAHSVNNIGAVYAECGLHQIDFMRRDCERLFKHGQRMIEATSSLFREDSKS
jgi:hypothetical protein